MTKAPPLKPGEYEIRRNEDGSLDEVVVCQPRFFHLEQMDDGHWWMRIDANVGGAVVVNLSTKRNAKIYALAEEE